MIPAPLLALIRYAVVWECGRLVGHGWTFFALDPDTTDAVVQGLAMLVAVSVASIGAIAARVRNVVARLKAHHRVDLLDAAASVPGVTKIQATQELALVTASPKVVAAP